MTGRTAEASQRIQLVEQNLHATEVVDGIFDIRPDAVAAVTSERIIVVSGGTRAWALTAIPWRAVIGVDADAAGPNEAATIRVRCRASQRRVSRNGEAADVVRTTELSPQDEPDLDRIVALMKTRLALVTLSPAAGSAD